MSNPSPTPIPHYEEDWLPEDFKPMTFRQLMWHKLKGAPLVGVGGAATLYSFAMASYYMRLGNSAKFNIWLRWRVLAQTATVGAAIYYGGVAMTSAKQNEYFQKQRVLLGELPTNTPIPVADNSPSWWPWSSSTKEKPEDAAYRAAVYQSQNPPLSSNEGTDAYYQAQSGENAKYYPLPLAERMKAQEFAARLRAAERAHEEELANKSERVNTRGGAADLLVQRMEKAYADRPEGTVERKWKVQNKHKLRKQAEAAEAEAAAKEQQQGEFVPDA